MTRCLVLQHLEPERPCRIASLLEDRGVEIERCEVFAGNPVPPGLGHHEALVVMGGPMSATSDDTFATRGAELKLLEDAPVQGLPVLGVCLGAQLLALAAGARVYKGNTPFVPLHWHGDTFDLPSGSTHLARSDRYDNQAFRLGEVAWGLQLHIEVDLGAVEAFVMAFGDDARADGVAPESIRARAAESLEALEPLSARVLGRFADAVRARAASR